MKWISIIATLPLLCSHTGRLGTMTRGSQSHGWLCFLFFLLSTVYLFSSSLFPLQNQSHSHAVFFFHSHTQFELWVHSPLIHCQSYLSSGTIATVRAQLRTTARRKIALLPQGCGTLCSQPRQPSSLSLLHIKSSSWRVEKKIPVPACLTAFQMEFLLLQRNRRRWQMTNCIRTWCHFVSVVIYCSSLCLLSAELRELAVRAILLFM